MVVILLLMVSLMVVADGYNLESTEVFGLVSCDDVVPGCMDETAFNYIHLQMCN